MSSPLYGAVRAVAQRRPRHCAVRDVDGTATAAGIAGADHLSPHSLRHSVTTMLLDRGHPLHVVQDFLGHADPRTTRRYDRARESLDRSPAYDLAAALAAGVARYARAYRPTGGGAMSVPARTVGR